MHRPIKRKKTRKHCPINANGLLRRFDNGDDRIDGDRIEELLEQWRHGKKIPWRTLGPTFIKRGRPIPNQQIQEDNGRPVRRQRIEQRQIQNVADFIIENLANIEQ